MKLNTIDFIRGAHAGQYRKGFPAHFITHPLAVAAIVMEYSGASITSDITNAALLHDVVEDTEYTHEDIIDFFGDYVAAVVATVTHVPGLKGREKREAYIRALNETRLSDAVLVSCADKLDNLRSIRHQQLIDADGAREFEHGLWFYDRLFPIYQRVLPQHFPQTVALLSIFEQTLQDVKIAYGPTNL